MEKGHVARINPRYHPRDFFTRWFQWPIRRLRIRLWPRWHGYHRNHPRHPGGAASHGTALNQSSQQSRSWLPRRWRSETRDNTLFREQGVPNANAFPARRFSHLRIPPARRPARGYRKLQAAGVGAAVGSAAGRECSMGCAQSRQTCSKIGATRRPAGDAANPAQSTSVDVAPKCLLPNQMTAARRMPDSGNSSLRIPEAFWKA